jgi:hypothetical protein
MEAIRSLSQVGKHQSTEFKLDGNGEFMVYHVKKAQSFRL